jgi:hypothetical protein
MNNPTGCTTNKSNSLQVRLLPFVTFGKLRAQSLRIASQYGVRKPLTLPWPEGSRTLIPPETGRHGYRRPDFLFRLILSVRLVPRFLLLGEHDIVRTHQPRERPASDVRCEVNLLIEFPATRGFVCARRPLCRPDRSDEAGRDEKRRPELGPVRPIRVAADVEAHCGSIAKNRRIRSGDPEQPAAVPCASATRGSGT